MRGSRLQRSTGGRRGNRSPIIIGLPLACVVVLGCTNAARSTSRAPSPRALPQCAAVARPVPRDSFPPYGGPRPPEDLALRVSRVVPGGFTSFEAQPTGPVVLRMADTARADTVRAALAVAFAARGDSAFAARIRDARVRQVAFSLADLVDWKTYLSGLLFNEAGRGGVAVSMVGVDFHRGHVAVYVPGEAERARVEARLARGDLPCGLVETRISGAPVSIDWIERSPRRPRDGSEAAPAAR